MGLGGGGKCVGGVGGGIVGWGYVGGRGVGGYPWGVLGGDRGDGGCVVGVVCGGGTCEGWVRCWGVHWVR